MHCCSLSMQDRSSGLTMDSRIVEIVTNPSGGGLCLARTVRGRVSLVSVDSSGGLEEVCRTDSDSDCRIALSPVHPGQYCVSSSSGVSLYDGPELMFSFASSGGPVVFNPSDSNQIFLGTKTCVSVLDVREGCSVSSFAVHPAALSLTAYSRSFDFSSLAVNPARPVELAAVSKTHSVIQLFDIRNTKGPVTELALPGRDRASTPFRWFWKSCAFSPDGSMLSISRPLDSSCLVMQLVSPSSYSPIQRVDLTKPHTGMAWSRFGLEFYSPLGSIHHITSSCDAISTTEDVLLQRSVMDPQDLVTPTDVSKSLDEIEKVKNLRVTLERFQQIFVQSYVGACRGLRGCKQHPLAKKAAIGSYHWRECVEGCGGKLAQGTDLKGPKRTSIWQIRKALAILAGETVSEEAIRRFIHRLAKKMDRVLARIELKGDLVIVLPGEPVVVAEAEEKVEVLAVAVADTPPLPENPDIFFSSSESDDGEAREDNLFTRRRELVKPKLLLANLKNSENDRLLTTALVDSLRTKWVHAEAGAIGVHAQAGAIGVHAKTGAIGVHAEAVVCIEESEFPILQTLVEPGEASLETQPAFAKQETDSAPPMAVAAVTAPVTTPASIRKRRAGF